MNKVWSVLSEYIYMIPVILSLPVHEFAHAYVSYRLGDPTAKDKGRLTLNPLKHLDPIGTILLVIAHIGWAKPVPINPIYYKNRKLGMLYTALAGPVSNLILSFTFSFLYIILFRYMQHNPPASETSLSLILSNIVFLFINVNVYLAIFNLLPVPPLDGSKILSGILPDEKYFKFLQHERIIGIVFFIAILLFSRQFSTILRTLADPVISLFLMIANFIVNIFI